MSLLNSCGGGSKYGSKESHEAAINALYDKMDEMSAVLMTVEDDVTGEKALAEIESMAAEMRDLVNEVKKLKDPREEEKPALLALEDKRKKESSMKLMSGMMKVKFVLKDNKELSELIFDQFKNMESGGV